jgi:hypothetical protein
MPPPATITGSVEEGAAVDIVQSFRMQGRGGWLS